MVTKSKDSGDLPMPEHGLGSAVKMAAPPLKPFSKNGDNTPGKPIGRTFHPEIPRRVGEIPGVPGHEDQSMSLADNANRLTVGQNICLNGEITSCEKLVVEGRVEASLVDANMIEVAANGCFKGSADVEKADISGYFEGTLVAKEILTIRKDGRVNGSVRYGKIIIESGGTISGDMASLDSSEGAGKSSDGN